MNLSEANAAIWESFEISLSDLDRNSVGCNGFIWFMIISQSLVSRTGRGSNNVDGGGDGRGESKDDWPLIASMVVIWHEITCLLLCL